MSNIYGEDKQDLAERIANETLRDKNLVVEQSGVKNAQPKQPGDHRVRTSTDEEK